jgi:hypothetical protein
MPRTIKLYAHNKHEEADYWAEQAIANDPSLEYETVFDLINNRPLYEVEFEFDVDTGKCIKVSGVDGGPFFPKESL